MAEVAPIRKRRLVIGAMFIAIGLAALSADLFDASIGSASAIGTLVGSTVLLIGLVLRVRHNGGVVGDLFDGEWDT